MKKLSDYGVPFEIKTYFSKCRVLQDYPDSSIVKEVPVSATKKICIFESCLSSDIEQTIFAEQTDSDIEQYNFLSGLTFYYIAVVTDNNIDNAFIPEYIFDDTVESEKYIKTNYKNLIKD